MSKWLLVVLLSALCSCQASAGPLEKARRAVVSIRADAGPICAGVAVGKHTVATQAHCLTVPPGELKFNGTACPTDQVVAKQGDNVLVHTCATFKHPVRYYRLAVKEGMRAVHWGHPYGLPLLYREGYYAGKWEDSYLWVMENTNGDSGGPIFSLDGRLICTVSFAVHRPGDGFQLSGCYPPMFTSAQLKEIK